MYVWKELVLQHSSTTEEKGRGGGNVRDKRDRFKLDLMTYVVLGEAETGKSP